VLAELRLCGDPGVLVSARCWGGQDRAVPGTVPEEDFAALADVAGVVIEILAARNAELQSQVDDLAERLARLERALSRNSGNSGMSPSSDDLPGRTAPGPKPKRGNGKKKPGG
jgi:uncharacterized protein DUF6444